MAVTLSASAAKHVEKQLASRGKGIGIRLGVRPSGCSGMAYVLEFVDDSAPEDTVFDNHGVKVVVDPKSYLYVMNTTLDFSDGLNGTGFNFQNPNAKKSCGCGSSFAV